MKALRTALLSVLLVAALAGFAGCARSVGTPGSAVDSSEPAPAPTTSAPGATPPSGALTLPPAPSVGVTATLTGTIVEGAEPSCLILQTPSGMYELLSPRPIPAVGAQVIVVGRVTHVMSHCMQGLPFSVQSLTVKSG
jgi:hypothetical protein